MKRGRLRTESMVQRFAKKPLSEGYELWDRDYPLGAMRLFIFKAETAPPFQLAPCVDAAGEILCQIDEQEDANEQFTEAADTYGLIQQPILAALMRVKSLECTKGAEAAHAQLAQTLAEFDPEHNGGGAGADAKKKAALARCYAYMAELILSKSEEGAEAAAAPGAVSAATMSVELGWDRVHTAHVALGDAYHALGENEKAMESYSTAAQIKPLYLAAFERQLELLKSLPDVSDGERAGHNKRIISVLDQALKIHPRPTLVREKAFLIAEMDGDVAGLAYLDPLIQQPPPEEADCAEAVGGSTMATLLKAKAAILADAGRMAEALTVAEAAVAECPRDEEAALIVEDIKAAMEPAAA